MELQSVRTRITSSKAFVWANEILIPRCTITGKETIATCIKCDMGNGSSIFKEAFSKQATILPKIGAFSNQGHPDELVAEIDQYPVVGIFV